MKAFIVEQLLKPLAHRVASATAMALAATGMATEDISTVSAAAAIIAGFAVDFVVRKFI